MLHGTVRDADVQSLRWNEAKKNLIDALAGLTEAIAKQTTRIEHANRMIDLALQSADPSQKVFLNLAKELLK